MSLDELENYVKLANGVIKQKNIEYSNKKSL